ncbi:MAG: FtsW/RodA/SpoVE family cell cycle protein [Planctomycetota bacterium]
MNAREAIGPEEALRLRRRDFDRLRSWMLGAATLLLGLGVVLVYSASAIRAERYGSSLYFLERQLTWMGVGLAAFFLLSRVDYRRLASLRWVLLGAALGLLGAVLFFGPRINGARRWLRWGAYSLQPSEAAKVLMVVVMAAFLARLEGRVRSSLGRFLAVASLALAAAALIAVEPDIGTALLVAVVLLAMLVAGGARIRHIFVLLLLAGPPAAYLLATHFSHIMGRIHAWIEGGTSGKAYHAYMSLQSLGSGGLFGMGPGAGWAKLYYLPEAHTDFIFAMAGQEFGLVCSLGILTAFAVFVGCGARLSRLAPDAFGSHLAFGLTLMIGLQAALHVAVVTAAVPTKGISLPFVSFGGSGLVCSLAALGILASIARHAWRPEPGYPAAQNEPADWRATLFARPLFPHSEGSQRV